MKSGQFVRGKIDGIQKHFESIGIGQLLPIDKLSLLMDYVEIGEFSHFFKHELVVAKIIVVPAENTDGRSGGIVNHTVLYQFDKIIQHDEAQYIFNLEAFIVEIQDGKRNFKMPSTPELPKDADTGLIPLPPPVEWEEP